MKAIRLGTRPSRLAMAQTEMVAYSIKKLGYSVEIVKYLSEGDSDLKSPLYSIGRTGVFVDRINALILSGEIDAAVHSAKDIPYTIDERLQISAVMPRGSFEDALVSDMPLSMMPPGSTIGTSSLRRKYQILYQRSDLKVVNLRGNIDTRIEKMRTEGMAGMVMALAAIERLHLGVRYWPIDPEKYVPAPNQGIIAVVSQKGSEASDILSRINDSATYRDMMAERTITQDLRLGCSTPVGILSRSSGKGMRILAQFFSMDGSDMIMFDQHIEDLHDIGDIVSYIRDNIPEEYGYNL
ncbi:hydroxymethylbilane synthase [Thermoplasma sp. Kam2015]|uniref:hydroxymethylbilane synthase n=1 Tax=Thermoplasma sp. Kam2015 TaxID=2094122 RepID=UPI000D89D150|nr:hydroxymethylbilane synthase [Thermoplasma sp. Kam2015]PYB68827.1 hydroxymethylbilane synthase [Thermoplasma sp. Kam2015]